jgi:hypothetical protein
MVRAMASTRTPDFTTLARRPSERLAIVGHVRDTATLEETDYLEWKSAYDLSSKPGAAAIARQLIGIAPMHWRVTASNTDGHQEGDIDFHVPTAGGNREPEPSDAQAPT